MFKLLDLTSNLFVDYREEKQVSSQSEKLGSFLKEVSNWQWDQFIEAERNKQYTSNQSIIFALVRACAMQQLQAIKIAVNRLDGKLKTPIKVEYPKIYYLFPNAKISPGQDQGEELYLDNSTEITNEVREIVPAVEPEPEVIERDLPSMGFRETLTMMSDYPRELPEAIIDLALKTEQWKRGHGPQPDEIPMVKSVVAAHLLTMAQQRNLDAITEVFDQIDGKLVETFHILGEDMFITSYATVAPEGAELNKDGVLQMEATIVQDMWATKLGRENKS